MHASMNLYNICIHLHMYVNMPVPIDIYKDNQAYVCDHIYIRTNDIHMPNVNITMQQMLSTMLSEV